jgi:hypothetical protein
VSLGRVAIVAALVLAGLTFATSALAESPTELNVYEYQTGLGHPADVEVDVSVAASAAATARLTVDVPAGYGLDLTDPRARRSGPRP